MKLIKDMVYATQDTASQVLDIYIPDVSATQPADVFIYFHGGALEAGDKVCDVPFHRLVEAGKIVVSANYRMYPQAAFPDFLVDGAAVISWVKEHLQEYTSYNRIFVGGSSAGAYITAMLAFDEKYLAAHNIKTIDIDGYLIDSAQMTTHYHVLRERGVDTRRIVVDEAAPIYHITETTPFPNIMVLVSDNDMACRLEQNLMFLKTAEMFHWPKEKLQYKLMEGFTHCGYCGLDLFAEIILEFIG